MNLYYSTLIVTVVVIVVIVVIIVIVREASVHVSQKSIIFFVFIVSCY